MAVILSPIVFDFFRKYHLQRCLRTTKCLKGSFDGSYDSNWVWDNCTVEKIKVSVILLHNWGMIWYVVLVSSCPGLSSEFHVECVWDMCHVCVKLPEIQHNSAIRSDHGEQQILACCCDDEECNCDVVRSIWELFSWEIWKCSKMCRGSGNYVFIVANSSPRQS